MIDEHKVMFTKQPGFILLETMGTIYIDLLRTRSKMARVSRVASNALIMILQHGLSPAAFVRKVIQADSADF